MRVCLAPALPAFFVSLVRGLHGCGHRYEPGPGPGFLDCVLVGDDVPDFECAHVLVAGHEDMGAGTRPTRVGELVE